MGEKGKSSKYKSINNKDLRVWLILQFGLPLQFQYHFNCQIFNRGQSFLNFLRYFVTICLEANQCRQCLLQRTHTHRHSPHTQCDTHVIIVSAKHFLRNNRAGTKHLGSYLQVWSRQPKKFQTKTNLSVDCSWSVIELPGRKMLFFSQHFSGCCEIFLVLPVDIPKWSKTTRIQFYVPWWTWPSS
jgi:hypothetical protein